MNFEKNSEHKRINLNRLFMNIGILYGPYDGQQQIVYRLSTHIFCQISLWFLLLYAFKFGSLFFIGKHPHLAFILTDHFHKDSESIRKFMAALATVYTLWSFCLMWTYQRVNVHKHDAYWLMMLPFDQLSGDSNKKQLTAMNRKHFKSVERMYHKYGGMSIKLVIFFIVFMSTLPAVIYGQTFYKIYHNSLNYFWPVLLANTLLMTFFNYLVYFLTLGMSLNYAYLAFLMKHRFDNVERFLQKLANDPKSKTRRIKFRIRQFNLVIVDMLR